jgi:hypothetical protein
MEKISPLPSGNCREKVIFPFSLKRGFGRPIRHGRRAGNQSDHQGSHEQEPAAHVSLLPCGTDRMIAPAARSSNFRGQAGGHGYGVAVAQKSDVVPHLQNAIDIYREEANIRVIPSKPFQYDSPFGDDETATED